ncbi:MAG: S9 family peptidase [Spirosoma sp.]|nr:S9 family peptidase [Spirosoma sp.]
MKTNLLFVISLSFIGLLVQAQPKPPLSWKAVAAWKDITTGSTQLSPDGQWFAYVTAPTEGDAELIVQKIADSTRHSYPIGSATLAPDVKFSDDGRWVVFMVSPTYKEQLAAAKPGAKPLTKKAVLVELAPNKKTEFERVKSLSFNGEKVSHLALLLSPATASPVSITGTDAVRGADLLLYELGTGKTQNIGNVADMAFDKKGNWLAITIDAVGQSGNGLSLRNMTTGVMLTLDSDKARYQSLAWTEQGDGLALLKSVKDEAYKNERFSILGVRNLSGTPELIAYNPKADSVGFPRQMTISPNRAPSWSEDLSRLIFGVHKLEAVPKSKGKAVAKTDTIKAPRPEQWLKLRADTTIKSLDDLQKALARLKTDSTKTDKKEDTEKPEVTIWHWQDKRLQSRQQVQEKEDKSFSFLSMYDLTTKKFTQLADSAVRVVAVAPKELFALGRDESNYELEANLTDQAYADIYLYALKTGQRTKILTNHYLPGNAGYNLQPSPDGQQVLYWESPHFHVYNMVTRTDRAITSGLLTSFINPDVDVNQKTPPHRVIGWSSDSKSVLLSDGWDIWQVPAEATDAKGKALAAINLTQNGKRDEIRYQSRFVLAPDEKGIDLKQPIFVRMYGEWTKKSGIARIDNGKSTVLSWADASVGNLSKAKKAPVYAFSRETFTQPRDFFVSQNPGLTVEKPVTQKTSSIGQYAWSPGVKLIDYVSDKGDSLQGALFLPAGYEQGKKYPTIVYYYEKLSQTLHNYVRPGYSGTGWNPSVYTSQGYAVFIPDIVYKLNDPGMSAVWCVLPGVKAALKTGVIDEKNIGIHGHSWGGYQTSFLITQTNQFKAAAAGAPLTDMVSMYNLIYLNSGNSNGSIFEGSQGRLVAPWENWDAYARNSPMYHVKNVQTPLLMLHNDKDGAVDFTQGIEFYNALRRQHKPVVLVQYKGENHGLAKLPNRKDYAVRMLEFFDHHLKGKPAPTWLQKGVQKLELDEHIEKQTAALSDN